MYITKLKLDHFRNIQTLELNLQPGLTVFTGENAQGKTNLLEAVHLLCTGRSHRTNHDREMIFHDREESFSPRAYVAARCMRREGERHVEVALSLSGKKAVRVNNSSLFRLGELMGHMNTVMFAPEDLGLIREGPGRRRRFLDMTLAQIQPDYYFYLQRYQKALDQRNDLLKAILRTGKGEETLPVWEEALAENGAWLAEKRQMFCEKLSLCAQRIHFELSEGKENLVISYEGDSLGNASERKKQLLSLYEKNRTHDLRFGMTSSGPHHDDLGVKINGFNAKTDASQGQRRTAVLALKLAELELMEEATGEVPILLLDDVFSELDAARRELLRQRIGRVQTLLTCVDAEGLNLQKGTAILRVSGGKIKK